MAEYSAPGTLTAPGPLTITFNTGTLPFGYHDPDMCSGLEVHSPRRAVTEDRPRTHGGIAYPRLKRPREIVLGGWALGASLAARSGWIDDLAAVLDALDSGGGTYVWVESVGTKTVSDVWSDGNGLTTTGKWIKKYQFSLVAPDPDIT